MLANAVTPAIIAAIAATSSVPTGTLSCSNWHLQNCPPRMIGCDQEREMCRRFMIDTPQQSPRRRP